MIISLLVLGWLPQMLIQTSAVPGRRLPRVRVIQAAFLLAGLGTTGCGDDAGGPGDRMPSDAEQVEHLRRCAERCAEERRCSESAPPEAVCDATCEAMAPDATCRELHADYADCLDTSVPCDNYERAAEVACGEIFQDLFLDCPPWRSFVEAPVDAGPGDG